MRDYGLPRAMTSREAVGGPLYIIVLVGYREAVDSW